MLSEEITDPIDIDILNILIETPDCRKRCSKIEEELMPMYSKKYDKQTFHTHFNRSIKRLCINKLLTKETLGHQNVFYLIPLRQREKIKMDLQKIRNAKIFTKLDLDEQQKLLLEVKFLRENNLSTYLFNRSLPGYSIISECEKRSLNYRDFNPESWQKVLWCTEDEYTKALPSKLSPSSLSIDPKNCEVEIKAIPEQIFDPDGYMKEIWSALGWNLLGTSVNGTVLCCRLKIVAEAIKAMREARFNFVNYLVSKRKLFLKKNAFTVKRK